jgi:hypothetical protein
MTDFDHSKCKNPIRKWIIFNRYFALQKATTWWNSTERDGTEKISYLSFSRIRLNEQEAFQIILFKYMLNFSKIR